MVKVKPSEGIGPIPASPTALNLMAADEAGLNKVHKISPKMQAVNTEEKKLNLLLMKS
jgi:hypothetical protein